METQKYCSVRVSGPKNQNGGFPQNLPGRFTSVCSVMNIRNASACSRLKIFVKYRGSRDYSVKITSMFYTDTLVAR